ncbi:MAG: hypothetical protein AB1540_16000 [Bdellovibrionota bacterium]
MDRRKDTTTKSTRIPRDYLKLIEDIFNKNFSKFLIKEKAGSESFVASGEIYPDEVLVAVSLKNPKNLRMTTCYASIDYPPPQLKLESGKPAAPSASGVEICVNSCVDGIASFFATFFDEGRPVDYDVEYRQNWTAVEIEKKVFVYLRINRDNPELEAQADALLEEDADVRRKKKLH